MTTPDFDAAQLLHHTVAMENALNDAASHNRLRRTEISHMMNHAHEHDIDATDVLQASVGERVRQSFTRIKQYAAEIDVLKPPAPKSHTVVNLDNPQTLPPQILLEAYELLYIQAYGSGAIQQDTNAIHGVGARENPRTDSSKPVPARSGAIQKKKLSSSRKNVIKDLRAYHHKVKLDKKLRRLGKEVYAFLEKEQVTPQSWIMKCTKCKKLGEDDWQHCPRCGATMTRTQR